MLAYALVILVATAVVINGQAFSQTAANITTAINNATCYPTNEANYGYVSCNNSPNLCACQNSSLVPPSIICPDGAMMRMSFCNVICPDGVANRAEFANVGNNTCCGKVICVSPTNFTLSNCYPLQPLRSSMWLSCDNRNTWVCACTGEFLIPPSNTTGSLLCANPIIEKCPDPPVCGPNQVVIANPVANPMEGVCCPTLQCAPAPAPQPLSPTPGVLPAPLAQPGPSPMNTPAPGANSSIPAPGANSSIPAPGTNSNTPAPGANSSIPAPGTNSNTPAPAHQPGANSSVPAPGTNSSVPAPGTNSSIPAPAHQPSPSNSTNSRKTPVRRVSAGAIVAIVVAIAILAVVIVLVVKVFLPKKEEERV